MVNGTAVKMLQNIAHHGLILTIARYEAAFTCVEQSLRFLSRKFNVQLSTRIRFNSMGPYLQQ